MHDDDRECEDEERIENIIGIEWTTFIGSDDDFDLLAENLSLAEEEV